MPIAMGTEEMEAVILAGVLRRAGADVTLASVEDGLEVEASYGTRIIADKSIAACADQEFDLVALPVIFRATALIRSWSLLTPMEAREHLVTGSIRWEMVARDIFNRFGWRSCNRIGN